MATAVASSSKPHVHIADPFHRAPSSNANSSSSRPPPVASSSRLHPSGSQPSAPSESRPRTFSRLRTSLEQTLRTSGKTKGRSSIDEVGAVTDSRHSKGKERASEDTPVVKEKTKSSMLSKVTFRRTGGGSKDSNEQSSGAAASNLGNGSRIEGPKVERDRDKGKVREAGYTSFQTPSLRQASMSSPALHLSSQPFPSPYSQSFAVPAASSSNVAALVSPTRERAKKHSGLPSISTRDISGPAPLSPKRDSRPNGSATPTPEQKPAKHRPPPVSTQIANAGAGPSRERASIDSVDTPTRRTRAGARSPDLSPPLPSPRSGGLAATSSRRAAASASHLPLNANPSTPSSPTTPRPISPTQARSSSRPHRAGPSASTSHLPLSPPVSPSPPVRRPSADIPRSTVSPSPTPSRAASPTSPTRPRAASPPQRNYSPIASQLRSINASTTSLNVSASPEQRELVRNASSLLIKEMLKPPSQIRESGLDPKDYEEVEVRLRSLARLERVWGKSGSGMLSTSQLGSVSGLGGISAGGEERERRHFGEALRDGYVLCQLVNKLHPGFIPRVDRREDGFVRTSNVTKFLAACSSLGVPAEELFHRDDLIEGTPDSMARVAKSIIALLRVTEFPAVDRSKIVQGGQIQRAPSGPYSSNRAAASTPNLSSAQRSISPTQSAPANRKRVSPTHHPLPTLRSDSPNESDSDESKTANAASRKGSDGEQDVLPPMMTPPPRSPLRPRASMERSSIADSTRASVGDSLRVSYADSIVPPSPVRQSLASSHMTDTTAMSSLFDLRSRRNSDAQNSKFGTLRTMTTEATSFVPSEDPSLTQSEAKAMATTVSDEISRRRSGDGSRPVRDRRPSETAAADLTRVLEEAEESSTSAKGARSGSKTNGSAQPVPIAQRPKLRLGKGKWPDDFLGLSNDDSPSSALLDDEDLRSPPRSPLSASPPRKLVVVPPRANGSTENVSQFNRRPSHRSRHSVDTPGLLPREALLRRDSSPDGKSVSPNPRIMLRRTSTRNGPNRNGVYIPRNDSDDSPVPEDSPVPFPTRAVSGEHSTPPSAVGVHFPPELTKGGSNSSGAEERPRMPRGRFQSEIDGSSSRRKPRPNSFDDAGARPRRSRFESMVNLGAGVGSANASASDLMGRNEGSAVRQTLIVKEDGKPSTQFQLGNCIGRGQFGAVYRALNLNTGQMVAVKRISLDGLREDEISQLMREVDLVKSLSHPSIVKYEGMARDENALSIVLEYAENGSLGQTLKAFGKLNERLIAGYVVKILEGLHYLHQSDVVHCDLKAANILTTKNGNVKLSDFGVSLNLRAMEREIKDVAGTPNWMAPEVIELKGASTKSDIWSLGCTVIELLTGRPPYGDIANTMSVMFRIVEDDSPPLPDGCSDLLKDFLKQCFYKDPSKRPSAELLCEHDWLKQNWALHNKDLRPQDSIPFLRRVSADLQKSEAIKYLARIEMPEVDRSTPEIVPTSPIARRLSNDIDAISPREHSFVKTTFGKPVICRVCNTSVKRSAVLCEQCSLIAHGRCAHNAPPTCDLRAQLLLYAQYAENGTPLSSYGNPLEFLAGNRGVNTPPTPMSETGMSSRTSIDTPSTHTPSAQPSTPSHHPPTAYKVLNAFKRSRSFLRSPEDESPSPTPPTSPPRRMSRKSSVLLRKNPAPKERPVSIASSASPPNSSLRSSGTDSLNSRPDTVRQSAISIAETDMSVGERTNPRLSRMTSVSGVSIVETDEAGSYMIPGDMNVGTTRDKKRDGKGDKGGCVVQ